MLSFCLSVGNAKISSSTGSFVLRIFIQISYYINLMLLDYINDDPIKIMHGPRLKVASLILTLIGTNKQLG